MRQRPSSCPCSQPNSSASTRPRISATTAGGIPEVVADGETGLLVLPRNPEALADAIIRLIDDRVLARRLAAGASSRLSRFGLKRMGEDMERVYDAIA